MDTETFTERIIRKTRKERHCDWCWQMIPAGSAAHRHSGMFEGEFFSAVMHPECWAALCACDWVNEEGYMPGEYGRGRTDDNKKAPPMFQPDGTKIEKPPGGA